MSTVVSAQETMKPRAKRTGRPAKPAAERRQAMLKVRLNDEDTDVLRECLELSGDDDASSFVRRLIRNERKRLRAAVA